MRQLLVRRLSRETVRQLRLRAAANGRSLEAEHRAILEEALGTRYTTEDLIKALEGSPLAELAPDELRDRTDTGRAFD